MTVTAEATRLQGVTAAARPDTPPLPPPPPLPAHLLLRLWVIDRAPSVDWTLRAWYLANLFVATTMFAVWAAVGPLTPVADFFDSQLHPAPGLQFWGYVSMTAFALCVFDVRWLRWAYPLALTVFWLAWSVTAAFADHNGQPSSRLSVVAIGIAFTVAAQAALTMHWSGRVTRMQGRRLRLGGKDEDDDDGGGARWTTLER